MKLSIGKRLSSLMNLPINFVLQRLMLAVMKGFGMQILVIMIIMSGQISFYVQQLGFNLWKTSRIPKVITW